MDKLLVSAATLQAIFAKHPEVEVELVSTATAQIAGRLTDKIMAKLPSVSTQLDDAFKRQLTGLKDNSRLHPEIKSLIRTFLNDECKSMITKMTADACLARADDLIKARMQKVEQEIAAGVKTATDLMRGQIEALAQEKFMELIRGAGKIGA